MINRLIEAIRENPHGKTARKAAHWLALEVMG